MQTAQDNSREPALPRSGTESSAYRTETAPRPNGGPGFFATAAERSMYPIRLLDRFLAWSRTVITVGIFKTVSIWFVKLGHIMMVGLTILSVIFWAIQAARQTNWLYLLYGLGCGLLFPVLQYAAHRFLNAGQQMIAAFPSRLSSTAFPDSMTLIAGTTGLLLFASSLFYRTCGALFTGLGLWLLCDLIACVALHPALANITIARNTAPGEEALGIVSFFAKALMRIVPMAFGAGVTLFFLALLNGTIVLLGRKGGGFEGETALRNALCCACLPILSYVFFGIFHLTIDIMRAILVIPFKLDRIRETKARSGEEQQQ